MKIDPDFRQQLDEVAQQNLDRMARSEPELRERESDPTERGRRSYREGKRFEDEVATLYRLLGFGVKQDVQISGMQIDLMIEKREGGLQLQAIVECKARSWSRSAAAIFRGRAACGCGTAEIAQEGATFDGTDFSGVKLMAVNFRSAILIQTSFQCAPGTGSRMPNGNCGCEAKTMSVVWTYASRQ